MKTYQLTTIRLQRQPVMAVAAPLRQLDAELEFTGGGSGVVDWDGRDSAGDEMGNGTYLYRVEIDTGDQVVVSEMQRLVMMK